MAYLALDEAEAELGMRALKAVAMADGTLHDLERRLLDAVQEHVTGTQFDLDGLAELSADELDGETLADHIPEEHREPLVHAALVVALIDGEASRSEVERLSALAKGLGVKSQALRNVRRLVAEHLRMLRIDILRRSFVGQRIRDYLGRRGFEGLMQVGRGLQGKPHPPTAAKYHALADLPKGTLGHGFFTFTQDNGFSFPGEEGGPVEPIVFHDCLHVLGEYGTSALEETQIASFQAGIMKKDPVFGLMFMLAQFQLGVQISPVADGQRMQVDPELALKAFLRGQEVTHDLVAAWQPWDDFEVPVTELRERYGIAPRT